jgi:hypothetical protein
MRSENVGRAAAIHRTSGLRREREREGKGEREGEQKRVSK